MGIRASVNGHESRSYRRAAWAASDVGHAAAGLGQVPFAAACFSYAGAREAHYWVLFSALSAEAMRLSRRESWPLRVPTEDGRQQFYRELLAALILDEDSNRPLFIAAPLLFSAYMSVTPETWDRSLSDPFRSLRSRYDSWLNVARAEISKWIRGD